VNTFEAVRAVQSGEIPPEADLVGLYWFEVLPVRGTVDVRGAVGAVRSASFGYRVEWTTGLQAPPHPGSDVWHNVAARSGLTAALDGTLATIDLADVAAAILGGSSGASSRADGTPDEDRFSVRIRVVVTDAEGRQAVAQQQVFVHDDPDLVEGSPERIAGADRRSGSPERIAGVGTASPVFADVAPGGPDELVVATDGGWVHVRDARGVDVQGWPQRTEPAAWWPSSSPVAREFGIAAPHDRIGVGAPVVADLDADGSLDLVVADDGGAVTAWRADGSRRFRVVIDPDYSDQEATNDVNRLKRSFLASPAAGDLDGDGRLEIVAAAMDRHVYAWHDDGRPVVGFPVLVVDPDLVSEIDPVSRAVTFAVKATIGGELVVTPAVGDLDGEGRAEIVVGAQESYSEPVAVFPGIGLPGVSGNTRLYAIHGDGTAHVRTGPDRTAVHPDDPAYLPGWPTKLAMVLTGVLPTVGDGVNTQAATTDTNRDGRAEVVATSSAGPVCVLDASGRSVLDPVFGQQVAGSWLGTPFGPSANSADGGIITSAFGGPAVGDLNSDSVVDVAVPTVGLGQALDQLLPGRQRGDTQLSAWDSATGNLLTGFPHRTSDLAFFVTPALVDVDADGDRDVVAANGVGLLDAIDAGGRAAPGYPKLTGGWSVGTPGFGDLDGDGRAEMAVVRRDGVLMVWHTHARMDDLGAWWRFGHDGRNSGDTRTPR